MQHQGARESACPLAADVSKDGVTAVAREGEGGGGRGGGGGKEAAARVRGGGEGGEEGFRVEAGGFGVGTGTGGEVAGSGSFLGGVGGRGRAGEERCDDWRYGVVAAEGGSFKAVMDFGGTHNIVIGPLSSAQVRCGSWWFVGSWGVFELVRSEEHGARAAEL